MIYTFSEMLQAFVQAEARKLAEYDVKHGPTIGEMYEGLSATVLEKTLPEGLNLNVVSGFVVAPDGTTSGQIDCMLVRGDGEQIPYTSDYKWPLQDVLAVFEVKKRLHAAEMRDSFLHLREVSTAHRRWFHDASTPRGPTKIRSAVHAFEVITGVRYPRNVADLELDLSTIAYTLIMEQLAPVRIVLGYTGYASEQGLRDAFADFLEEQVGESDGRPVAGFGIVDCPSLITSGGYSLVKAAGQPYMGPMIADEWQVICSSPSNPLWMITELIWAKLSTTFEISMPWEDGIEDEVLHPFIGAKFITKDSKSGWRYHVHRLRLGEGQDVVREWEPFEVDMTQLVTIQSLVREGQVELDSEEFVKFLSSTGYTPESMFKSLRGSGLVVSDGKIMYSLCDEVHTLMTPDGRHFVGKDSTRISAYVESIVRARKDG